ncbi:C25 family cysteine peptidase [Spirosoma sp. KNUC1025]|uniref:putative type IX secretion system sortase PorU2 n=1 Tax=Spirosoma sp. KNUC1025 TaxID=2894082 RepID=UPI0038661A98|nr:C25 family cysteine peptidase [Spirosoma sp. KNUC1025]
MYMPHPLVRCILILLTIDSLRIQAQSVNDSDPTHWINYSQTYFKIPIAQRGLYRITSDELMRAGVPIGQIDPTTVRLFHRGVEQAIHIAGETDRHFDTGDFLEFYGRGNDGTQDSLLYRPRAAQPHTYYSLFNDTTAYFLTWQPNGVPGRRMKTYMDTSTTGLTAEPYHWEEDLRLFTSNYPGWAAGIPPKIEYSYYESGEGYTGPVQQKDKPYTLTFSLTNAIRTGPSPQLDILLAGRGFTDHLVESRTGSTLSTQQLLDSVRFSTYDNARIHRAINWNDVGSDGQLLVSTVSRSDANTDAYSVSYIRLRYPQRLSMNGQSLRLFQLAQNPKGRSLISITDVTPNTRFWDVSDPTAPVRIGSSQTPAKTASFVVQRSDSARIILGTSQPKSVHTIRPVRFTNWQERKPTYLIISHEALMQSTADVPNPVKAYAAYRASEAGGGHDTLTVTMQQLIDQYSYGERHPLAIRRFADQLLRQSQGNLQFLLLMGRGRSTPGIRREPDQASLDMVMTAGFPGSDIAFTAGLNGADADVPALPTGRINAGTPQEVINYLTKVKAYETRTADMLWRKNLLHLSGGETPAEIRLFRNLVDFYRDQAVDQALGAQVTTLSKTTDQFVESINVAKPVNEGVGLMTFFGHSGLDVTDLDVGFCSNDALGYHNQGRYPLLLVNGCAIGNFFYGRPTLSTDWVLTPNRGAIAAIAHSHLGYPDVLHKYTTAFYSLLADSTQLYKSIGQLQQETIRRVLAHSSDGRALANSQQMVLQGDPAIRLFPFRSPDYKLSSGGLAVQDANGQPLRSSSDSAYVRVLVQNLGQYRQGTLPVRVRRFVNGRESGIFNWVLPKTIAYQDTLLLAFPNESDSEGLNQFEVTINPADSPAAQPESNRANNQAVVELTLDSVSPVLIYPAPGSTVNSTSVRLTAHYAAVSPQRFELEFDSTARFSSSAYWSKQLTASTDISYPITLPDRPNVTYYWRIRRISNTTNSAWVTGTFLYAHGSVTSGLPEGQIQLARPLPADIQQGDRVNIPVGFTNLSPYPFSDSLVVRQTIYASGLSNPQTSQWRIMAPIGNDTLWFTSSVFTEKLPGLNRIILTVNPRVEPEYSFLNNTLDIALPVQPDEFGPLLDVAFDGARITDGAVVSANPVIDVLVADENRSLIRRDTLGLDLFLKQSGKRTDFQRLNWQQASVQTTGPDNAFRIRYPFPTLAEGDYQLLVTARDAVSNSAVPYQVTFRVVSEQSLTSLVVYPNPFRGQTLFTFTLSGQQAPANVLITLTDRTGRVVRHLRQAVRIGRNEWAWDGRSDTGEILPEGTYIYKLVISDPTDWHVDTSLNEQLSGRIVLLR